MAVSERKKTSLLKNQGPENIRKNAPLIDGITLEGKGGEGEKYRNITVGKRTMLMGKEKEVLGPHYGNGVLEGGGEGDKKLSRTRNLL